MLTRGDTRNHDEGAHGRHLANTIERPVLGGDAGCRYVYQSRSHTAQYNAKLVNFLHFMFCRCSTDRPRTNPVPNISVTERRYSAQTRLSEQLSWIRTRPIPVVQLECWAPTHRPFVQVRTNTWSGSTHLTTAVSHLVVCLTW